MKLTIKIEELALFVLALIAFNGLDYSWWLFLAFFFAPDLSALAYLANPRIGATTYNLVHHKATAILIYIAGISLKNPALLFAGSLLFAHSSFDRVFGYGLKFPDSFDNTHLGLIGKSAKANS